MDRLPDGVGSFAHATCTPDIRLHTFFRQKEGVSYMTSARDKARILIVLFSTDEEAPEAHGVSGVHGTEGTRPNHW